ncbi:MAG: hypothetical protein FWC16_03470, partial [Defluviitaleaceae bacterium]|nr:hypothetical protein [Defluviitaleaceae bacterium]MCL2273962.1 hypothetical protein [Defluviitaleaceae bacterium]
MYKNLKVYLDKQIGEHGYVCIYRKNGAFLCEGKVQELRDAPLWRLMDEENAKITKSMKGT